LCRARDSAQWRDGFDVVLSPERTLQLDSPTDEAQARDLVASYAAIGATALNLRFQHRSLDHYLELLERFATEVAAHTA